MHILIDADATPRDALLSAKELGAKYGWHVTTVSSVNHAIDNEDHVTVDAHPQATDMKIVSLISKGVPTIVVTQDYGLAALVLAKGAAAVSPSGREYTSENIDLLLYERSLHAHERKVNRRNKGPKPRSEEQKEQFRTTLLHLLRRLTV